MITFLKFYNEESNAAGGSGSVFGPGTAGSIGSFGNQFPSQNDNAYNPGDYRVLSPYGAAGAVVGSKKNKKNKKLKLKIQRRQIKNAL